VLGLAQQPEILGLVPVEEMRPALLPILGAEGQCDSGGHLFGEAPRGHPSY
jgi:hypothetical protein